MLQVIRKYNVRTKEQRKKLKSLMKNRAVCMKSFLVFSCWLGLSYLDELYLLETLTAILSNTNK